MPSSGPVTRLKVAFVAVSYTAQRDGVSVYAENLLLEMLRQAARQRLALQVDIFVCGRAAAAVLENILQREEAVTPELRLIAAVYDGPLAKYLWVPLRLRSHGPYDCVFVPNLQPLWLPARRTLGVLHDLTYQVARAYFPSWRVRYMDLLTRFWLWRGMTIGCISRTTMHDLERFYPASCGRPHPYLPNGLPAKLAAAARSGRKEAEQKLTTTPLELIFVGRLNRLKGFDRVRSVCLRLNEYGAAWDIKAILHVVGKDTPESPQLLAELQLPRIRLIRHGYLDDRALNELYRRSGFCLLLSRNEGFGLPLLEAIRQCCVPLLSDIAIFQEVMGPEYPLFAGNAAGIDGLVDFVHRVRTDQVYRRDVLNRMDRVLAVWEGGYAQAARNLLAWATGNDKSTGEGA
ncbi:MAG: glycosyltransferase [Nitrococcus mobilis]|nr:glycosyltransferase [Nitrococcus mobilis]